MRYAAIIGHIMASAFVDIFRNPQNPTQWMHIPRYRPPGSRKYHPSRSTLHAQHGARECARHRRQIAAGQLRMLGIDLPVKVKGGEA